MITDRQIFLALTSTSFLNIIGFIFLNLTQIVLIKLAFILEGVMIKLFMTVGQIIAIFAFLHKLSLLFLLSHTSIVFMEGAITCHPPIFFF